MAYIYLAPTRDQYGDDRCDRAMQDPARLRARRQPPQRAEEIEQGFSKKSQERDKGRKSTLGREVEIDVVQVLVIPLDGNGPSYISWQIIQELKTNLFGSHAHQRMGLDHLPAGAS